jgi:hypothetical protein
MLEHASELLADVPSPPTPPWLNRTPSNSTEVPAVLFDKMIAPPSPPLPPLPPSVGDP